MRGSIFDLIIGIVLLLIVAISLIVFYYGNNIVMGAFANNTATNESTVKIRESMEATFNTFNYGFLFAFAGMLITICILAYYVDVHPMFLPFTIIIGGVAIFFSMYLSNAYWAFIQTSATFIAIAEKFWIVTHIMKNLPFYTTLSCGLIALVTYMGKRGRSGEI